MKPCTLTKDQLQKITARLESNQSTVTSESKELGFTGTSPLREWLSAAIGRDRYRALLHWKGMKTADGTPVASVKRARPDDSKLPVVTSMGKSEGWSWRLVAEHEKRPTRVDLGKQGTYTIMDGGDRLTIVIDPDGREFIEALENEKADLLRTSPMRKEPTRFVLYERSAMRKRIEKNVEEGTDELQRGIASMKAKREQKKALQPTLVEVASSKKSHTPKKAPVEIVEKLTTAAVKINQKQVAAYKAKHPTPKSSKKVAKKVTKKSRKSTKSSSRR